MKEIAIESLIYSVIVYFVLVSVYDIILKPLFKRVKVDVEYEVEVEYKDETILDLRSGEERSTSQRIPITLKKKDPEELELKEPLYRPEDLV